MNIHPEDSIIINDKVKVPDGKIGIVIQFTDQGKYALVRFSVGGSSYERWFKTKQLEKILEVQK